MTESSEPRESAGPVYEISTVVSFLVAAAWIVATVVAFVQWSRVSGGEQSPIEALVVMAPWVILAAGATSIRRLFD